MGGYLINSEGYIFCQKLKAESLKIILAASSCVRELTENALSRSEELLEKGLLNLNKIQHWDANGKVPSPDFIIRHAALGANIGNFMVDHETVPAIALVLETTSKFFGLAAKRNKDFEGGAKVQEIISRIAEIGEMAILVRTNASLALIVVTAKLASPVLDKLDKFALEHGQDWRTKTGGTYAR